MTGHKKLFLKIHTPPRLKCTRTQGNPKLHSRYQRAVILYIESRLLPSLRDFSVLCTYSKIIVPAAAAGISRSSQMSSSLPGQAVRYNAAGGTARPLHYKCLPLHPSPSARQDRTPCWVGSLRQGHYRHLNCPMLLSSMELKNTLQTPQIFLYNCTVYPLS